MPLTPAQLRDWLATAPEGAEIGGQVRLVDGEPVLILEGEPRPCRQCGARFMPSRRDAEFCSATCRQRARRARRVAARP